MLQRLIRDLEERLNEVDFAMLSSNDQLALLCMIGEAYDRSIKSSAYERFFSSVAAAAIPGSMIAVLLSVLPLHQLRQIAEGLQRPLLQHLPVVLASDWSGCPAKDVHILKVQILAVLVRVKLSAEQQLLFSQTLRRLKELSSQDVIKSTANHILTCWYNEENR